MPHKRAKAVGKLLFFDNKTTPRSIDRFGFSDKISVTFRRTFLFRTRVEAYFLFQMVIANKNIPFSLVSFMSRERVGICRQA